MTKIGKDVLKKKAKELKPTKTELEIKIPPRPLDLFTLRLTWEKEANRKLTDEEFERLLRKRGIFLKGISTKRRRKKLKVDEAVNRV